MRVLSLLLIFRVLGLTAQTGSLDPSFGSGGFVTTDISGRADVVGDMAVQPDGKILAVGSTSLDMISDMALVRYNPDGTLDDTFGIGGMVSTGLSSLFITANAVELLPDGKILVAGTANAHMFVARFLPDGTADVSFAPNGMRVLQFNTGSANRMTVQVDGKIILAGAVNSGPYDVIAVVRLLADGTFDQSFNGNGVASTDISGSDFDQAYGLTVQSDGDIVISGSADQSLCLVRYQDDGTLDPSFSDDGIFTHTVGASTAIMRAVAQQSDGRLVSAGSSVDGFANVITVLRLNTDGTLDSSFDGDGVAVASADNNSNASDIAIQPDGRIITTGNALDGNQYSHVALSRFNTNGSLDPTFGGDGISTALLPGHIGEVRCMVFDAQWNILVGGSARPLPTWVDMTVARFLNDDSTNLADQLVPCTFQVMPNPASCCAEIVMTAAWHGPGYALLHDANGRRVGRMMPVRCGSHNPLDIADLEPGVYTVEVISSGQVHHSRFLKQ